MAEVLGNNRLFSSESRRSPQIAGILKTKAGSFESVADRFLRNFSTMATRHTALAELLTNGFSAAYGLTLVETGGTVRGRNQGNRLVDPRGSK